MCRLCHIWIRACFVAIPFFTGGTGVITPGGYPITSGGTYLLSPGPSTGTVYTLTVNGSIIATATITVDIPIVVTAAGINLGGFFEMTVGNLENGSTYDLFYSEDLVVWNAVGVAQTADASGVLNFTDTVAVDPMSNAELYYHVELVP